MWILKLSGCLMVTFCGGLIGLQSALDLKNRTEILSKIILCTDEISQYIKIGTAEKNDILKKVLPKGITYEKSGLKTDISVKISGEDKRLINEFLKGLGMGDKEAEFTRCLAFKNLFEKQLLKAEKDVREKYKLYSLGGFFAGIIISFMWW